jgi:hypothetical protein
MMEIGEPFLNVNCISPPALAVDRSHVVLKVSPAFRECAPVT